MLHGFFFFLGIFIVLVQTSLSQYFPVWLGRPDLVYIFVVFISYRFNWFSGLLMIFCLGWMMDVTSGIHLGVYPLQNVLVFITLKLLTESSPLRESAYQVPLAGISYFVTQMGFYFLYSIFMPGTLPDWSWSRVVQETFILLAATIPFFILFNYLYEVFSKKRVIHKVVRRNTTNQFR